MGSLPTPCHTISKEVEKGGELTRASPNWTNAIDTTARLQLTPPTLTRLIRIQTLTPSRA